MKGIAHFVAGVAVATFFPEVVTSASQSLAFGPVWGGIAGLLPDTLDFRFVRYFDRVDEEIDPGQHIAQPGQHIAQPGQHTTQPGQHTTQPGQHTAQPGQLDPQVTAERIAGAMNRAYETGKRVKIRVHTLRLGADLWRQIRLTFDAARNEVIVRIGPVVTTGQVPLGGSEIQELGMGRAPIQAPMLNSYDDEVIIDIFSGPTLAFDRENGAVRITFLPWHRAWTHSALLALLVGTAGLVISPVVGLMMVLAVLSHVVTDQMGFMGSNLLFPFTKRRTMGWKLFRSGDALPNFLTVWVSLAVILLNLDRFSKAPIIPPLPYVVVAIALPCLLFLGLRTWTDLLRRRRRGSVQVEARSATLAAVEALDEAAEADL